MLSKINGIYSANFQGAKTSLLAKKSENLVKEAATKTAAGLAVTASTVLAMQNGKVTKPVSELSVSEMLAEYESLPKNTLYWSEEQKQRGAELLRRMSKDGYIANGKIK